jgi:hypothetical protein
VGSFQGDRFKRKPPNSGGPERGLLFSGPWLVTCLLAPEVEGIVCPEISCRIHAGAWAAGFQGPAEAEISRRAKRTQAQKQQRPASPQQTMRALFLVKLCPRTSVIGRGRLGCAEVVPRRSSQSISHESRADKDASRARRKPRAPSRGCASKAYHALGRSLRLRPSRNCWCLRVVYFARILIAKRTTPKTERRSLN